jgi:hypothetical protein
MDDIDLKLEDNLLFKQILRFNDSDISSFGKHSSDMQGLFICCLAAVRVDMQSQELDWLKSSRISVLPSV